MAFIGLGAGFTCDHPTDSAVGVDESSSASISAHVIQGQVTARGASLSGVAVRLQKPGANYAATTNGNGAFELGAVNPGTYALSARAAGVNGLPADVNITSLGTVDVASDAVLKVDAPTHDLTLAVTLGGAPLEGALVYCNMGINANVGDGRMAQGTQLMTGYTGEDGVFRSPLLPKTGTTTCNVYPLDDNQWRERFLVRDVNADIEVAMELPGVRYEGALLVNGAAVAGQKLAVAGSMDGRSTTTGDGAFQLGLRPGWYSLTIKGGDADGLLPAEYSLVGAASTGSPRRNIASVVTEELDLPVHVVTLEVTGIGGAPVEGAVVDQVVEGTAFPLAGWSIVDGTYRVRATSGKDGLIRLPLFPRAEGLELGVSAPEGTTLLDGSVSLKDVSGDAELSVSLAPANQAPVAHAGGPYVVDEGSAVKLDASGSSDADGDKLAYAWRLPDGSVVEGAVAEAVFMDGPDQQVAVLTVTDPTGLSSSAEARITVRNVAPSVATGARGFGIRSTSGLSVVSGESFELRASFDDPGEDAWSWHVDWGTGVISEGGASTPGEIVVPSPVFLSAGEHVVRIMVQDDDGDSGEAEMALTVERRPVDLDIIPGNEENPVRLKDKGNGVLPVAVLSDAEFDATTLDVSTIRLGGFEGGVPVATRGNGSHMATFADANGDGLQDLVLHFDRRGLVREHVTPGTTELVLHGTTSLGVDVEGVDAIRTK